MQRVRQTPVRDSDSNGNILSKPIEGTSNSSCSQLPRYRPPGLQFFKLPPSALSPEPELGHAASRSGCVLCAHSACDGWRRATLILEKATRASRGAVRAHTLSPLSRTRSPVRQRGARESPSIEVESMSPTSADYRMAVQAMNTTPECARLRRALARSGRSVACWAAHNRAVAAAAATAAAAPLWRQPVQVWPHASPAPRLPPPGSCSRFSVVDTAPKRAGLLCVLRDDAEARSSSSRILSERAFDTPQDNMRRRRAV